MRLGEIDGVRQTVNIFGYFIHSGKGMHHPQAAAKHFNGVSGQSVGSGDFRVLLRIAESLLLYPCYVKDVQSRILQILKRFGYSVVDTPFRPAP